MIPTRYQPSMDSLAEFIRKHPWWQWLTRTPFSAKMTKYALSSGIAFGLSEIAFAVCYTAGLGTIGCSVIAFFAAAIPNWIMNRRWAWQQKGRPPVKQTVAYVCVSAIVLVVTSVTTKVTNYWVKQNVVDHHGLRVLIVTGSFTVVTVILFFAKFAVYEFLIFSDDRGRGSRRRGTGGEGGRSRRGPEMRSSVTDAQHEHAASTPLERSASAPHARGDE